jgi:hypothetical protein
MPGQRGEQQVQAVVLLHLALEEPDRLRQCQHEQAPDTLPVPLRGHAGFIEDGQLDSVAMVDQRRKTDDDFAARRFELQQLRQFAEGPGGGPAARRAAQRLRRPHGRPPLAATAGSLLSLAGCVGGFAGTGRYDAFGDPGERSLETRLRLGAQLRLQLRQLPRHRQEPAVLVDHLEVHRQVRR